MPAPRWTMMASLMGLLACPAVPGDGGDAGAAHTPALPHATPSPPHHYDKEVVRRIVRSHADEIRACHEHDLAIDSHLVGRVTIELHIDARGRVEHASVREQSFPGADVPACIIKVMEGWTFPEPVGGHATIVHSFVLER